MDFIEKKAFAKLGYDETESKKLVSSLNSVLANYHLHFQKIRNFHWNIVGPDFFELHEKFEELYNQVQNNIDEIAERIRVFGKKPMSNLSDYLACSEIKEVNEHLSAREMVIEVRKDLEILLSFYVESLNLANEIGDAATVDLMSSYIREAEKTHWMFHSWLSSK